MSPKLTIQPYHNANSAAVVDIWSEQAGKFPDFFTPLSIDLLESQILGNSLFDAKGFLIALDDGKPVGFIHASFCPDLQGTNLSYETGILFAPIIRPDIAARAEIAETLILAGENYLRSHGTERWYAGGYASASPFYMGLYGRCNPEGILQKDEMVIDAFLKLGYHLFSESRRFRIELSRFHPNVTTKIHKAHRDFIVRRMPGWKAPNWWEANIYRNFNSMEWNVFSRDDHSSFPEPIAGSLFRQIQRPIYSRNNQDRNAVHIIMDYIGVLESNLRQGIASFLLTTSFNEMIADEFSPIVVDTIVESQDKPLIDFLLSHHFQETDSVRSLYKIQS